MADYIPGIFNYCDRWCERCPLTARCRSFALEKEIQRRSDDENARFWAGFAKGIQAEFSPAESPEHDGRDSSDEDVFGSSFAALEDEDDIPRRAASAPLSRAAIGYAMQLRRWLSQRGFRKESNSTRNPDVHGCDDALDILEWYSLQIGVKLTRAMSGDLSQSAEPISPRDDEFDEEFDADGEIDEAVRDGERRDRDGSAKVALIGIERSQGALTILRRAFPAEDATIRTLYRQLSQLRIEIDRRWPDARTFLRPGFDD